MRNACHAETALIVEQAKASGSTAPLSSFYSNIERMINKIFGIEPNSRNALTPEQRLQVSMAYSISTNAAKEVLSQGRPYKEAYALAKERISQFSNSMNYPALEVAA